MSVVWPVYELRPVEGFYRDLSNRPAPVWRLDADGWVDDDGRYGLAFAGLQSGAPVALYVDLPYQRNIVWSWFSVHWSSDEPRHTAGNAWHYALRPGTSRWGGKWERDHHPNERAGRQAMDFLVARYHIANGRGVRWEPTDAHVLAGLVRERGTEKVVTLPSDARCMYCDELMVPQAPAQGGVLGSILGGGVEA